MQGAAGAADGSDADPAAAVDAATAAVAAGTDAAAAATAAVTATTQEQPADSGSSSSTSTTTTGTTTTSSSTSSSIFARVWPTNYRRLDSATLRRAHEADVTPTVFDFSLWRRHRSRLRYVEHMATLPASHLMLDLAAPVLALAAAAAAVGAYETALGAGALPPFFPDVAPAAEGPFNAASFAMSLMLAFKVNASYARWNEARCLW